MRVAAIKRFRAWFLLATFVASLASAQVSLNHFDIIDTACGEVGLAAGTGDAQLTSPSKAGAQHCPVCHFLRAVSGASAAMEARLATPDGLASEFVTATSVPPAVHPITRPSRGPPTATLTFVI